VLNRLHVRNRLPCPPPPAAAMPTHGYCSHEIAGGKTDPEDGGDAQAKSDNQRTHNHHTLMRMLARQLRRLRSWCPGPSGRSTIPTWGQHGHLLDFIKVRPSPALAARLVASAVCVLKVT
jgi:hypothetical protein